MQLMDAASGYQQYPLWTSDGDDSSLPAPPHSKWNFGGYGAEGCGAHYGYDEPEPRSDGAAQDSAAPDSAAADEPAAPDPD